MRDLNWAAYKAHKDTAFDWVRKDAWIDFGLA